MTDFCCECGNTIDSCVCKVEECVFCNKHKNLKNIHFENKPFEIISIIHDKYGYALVLFQHNKEEGIFEIKYCPVCGKELKV